MLREGSDAGHRQQHAAATMVVKLMMPGVYRSTGATGYCGTQKAMRPCVQPATTMREASATSHIVRRL